MVYAILGLFVVIVAAFCVLEIFIMRDYSGDDTKGD